LDEKVAILERIKEKVSRVGEHVCLSSQYRIDNQREEIHFSISSDVPMGKVHRNVREVIRARTARTRLKHYTIFLYLNPIHPGKACMVWALHPGQQGWVVERSRRLPDEELVA
jgi:hypothetical protein